MPNVNSFPIKPLFGWQISETSCLPLYQTTDMQQWILHKNQCYERRSASSTARPSENERYDRRDDRRRDVDDSVTFWGCIPAAEIDFDVIALDIDVYLGPEVAPSRPSYRLPDSLPCFHYWLRLFLREYRAACSIVWLLLRLRGLCILSILPLCTNMSGFAVCWLTISRSGSMWKCKGRSLLLI